MNIPLTYEHLEAQGEAIIASSVKITKDLLSDTSNSLTTEQRKALTIVLASMFHYKEMAKFHLDFIEGMVKKAEAMRNKNPNPPTES